MVCITLPSDLPIVASGDRLACFEPQEKIWENESGQAFVLSDLIDQLSDIVAPLNGLGCFDISSSNYKGVIYRLPLRTAVSPISDNVYNTQKLSELLDALREEAKYLLLFLKSVYKVQVVHITHDGNQNLSFSVEITPDSIEFERGYFMQKLRQAHKDQAYSFRAISYSAQFSVIVTDNNLKKNQAGTTNWLLSNCVGSVNSTLQEAAEKQRAIPWIGTALEIGCKSKKGRIFCFLPIPVVSDMPIHINGTFRFSDDKQTVMLLGRNDSSANWNRILIRDLLPLCYSILLLEARKCVPPKEFYTAWPNVEVIQNNPFSVCLKPLLSFLFKMKVIWSEKIGSLEHTGAWINVSQAMFISEGSNLPYILKQVLTHIGIHLIMIPAVIWKAIQFTNVGIKEVTPAVVRSILRSHPMLYLNIGQSNKKVIFKYCVSDNNYHDLFGLELLPLADGSFASLDNSSGAQTLYLPTENCPSYLLPNLSHLLVNLKSGIDLHCLQGIALTEKTNLKVLNGQIVASLLTQVMPLSWQTIDLASMPNYRHQLTLPWLEKFWTWLKNQNLMAFENQLLIPCSMSHSVSASEFFLTRLSRAQPVIYISNRTNYSHDLLSALYKMNVKVCLQSEFGFVQHKDLFTYINSLNVNNVLDAITAAQSDYTKLEFTKMEAESLIALFSTSSYIPSVPRTTALQKIPMFSSDTEELYSVNEVASQSIAKQAIGEPRDCVISNHHLILLSRRNYNQVRLLKILKVPFPNSDVSLFIDYIIPIIENNPSYLIDSLMPQVLDKFNILNSRESSHNLANSIKRLPFIKTDHDRKSPAELFDPTNKDIVTFFESIKHLSFVKTSNNRVFPANEFDTANADIVAIYKDNNIFPKTPYNTPERIDVLKTCGLQTSIHPQILLDIIESISLSISRVQPQQTQRKNLEETKAVLQYISSPTFDRTSGYFSVSRGSLRYSFSSALRYLASSRSWLPILSAKPPGYPKELFWKGSDFESHFTSLSSSVVVLSDSTASTFPYLVGSQVYIVAQTVSSDIASMLQNDSDSFTKHVIAHFKEILRNRDMLSTERLDFLVLRTYAYMNDQGETSLRRLYKIPEWVFVKSEGRFVSPAVVALTQNSTFRRDLRPYIFILPDSLSTYTNLFGSASGILPTVSRSQILSVLRMIQEDIKANIERTTASEAWNMVLNILNWLTSNGSTKISDDINLEDVLLPMETESAWPQLVQVSETIYTENQFLMNYLKYSAEGKYTFVHRNVGIRLAHNLGAVPLSEILDISEDTFEDAGQHEPLTTRLKNILRDYKDGITIIKELLQNADDAEATEVNFCYDAREHEKDPKSLFFPGMAEAHGPALIVHNNSTFSDEDFRNITKLAVTTKKEDSLKIGEFGIGFCSVYHITDIPSFISRSELYIFDPTLSFLRREIKNPAKPGKKIDFTHHLFSGSGQLSPYAGLFGFNHCDYHGTMFRFPFRRQASELSEICYTEETIKGLRSAIADSSADLLLFLQHVQTITFQQINQGQSKPEVLLTVRKQHVPLPISLPSGVEIQELSSSEQSESCHWLVSQNNESNKLHTASVACPLGPASNYEVKEYFEGESFCFLPLCQKTGLPVHISSNFAVITSRLGILTSDIATVETDKQMNWNYTLMRTVIPKAYCSLLLALKTLAENDLLLSYTFYKLWPTKESLKQYNPWVSMLNPLYKLIASHELFYSSTQKKWLYMKVWSISLS